jgi:hypothetical protein
MGVNPTISNRSLKPFKQFVAEHYRESGKRKSSEKALVEERVEKTITDASAIVIDSTDTDKERADAIKGFAKEIANMSGELILAIAIASD